ncbi:MAG TPA: ankyrin repeat domain-containing protein [Steroidobacteraceae bacterium]|jgi:ankyrin repeat protein
MQALLDAIQADRPDDVVRILKAHPEAATTRSPAGLSALTLATYLSRSALVELIRPYRGKPDFFEACLLGDESTVRAELENGQDVNGYAPDGFTPLGLAVYFGHQNVTRMLLQQGAQVNVCALNAQQVGPIHAAVSRNDLSTLELLLAHGADPDLPQQQLFRPLHVAAANGNAAAAGLLLLWGARPGVRTESGGLPSEMARERGHTALAARLQKLEGANAPSSP